ncbi:hypothetical protein J437_LFUL005658 [Ladona fulva]|uniref:MPN domain-containing protein n=1 Tax=Ladona fulva TaxID=123851 RepID=A0A8K0JYD3_LADFU|nr:hypothetical protein J437_LFUL005658 [Ladona fulva]
MFNVDMMQLRDEEVDEESEFDRLNFIISRGISVMALEDSPKDSREQKGCVVRRSGTVCSRGERRAGAQGIGEGVGVEEEGDEEEEGLSWDDDEAGEVSDDEGNSQGRGEGGGGAGVGRSVTLKMLLSEGLLQPGEAAMSIDYLLQGHKFTGDLLPGGQIRSQESDLIFATPTAWAVHCKKIVNPDKKSGCGWASVKYRGQKLDSYKSSWFKNKKLDRNKENGGTEVSSECEVAEKDDKKLFETERGNKAKGHDRGTRVHREEEDMLLLLFYVIHYLSLILDFAMVIIFSDANTLVESTPFSSMGKIQPFLVSISSNTLLVMDFHCHLTTSEVVGYLGGHWDVNAHTPYLAESISLESTISSYWVMPPPESRPHEYGRPMLMNYSVIQDQFLSQDALNEMKRCADFYRGEPDFIQFSEKFKGNITYMEKLKATLSSKFPREHSNGMMWSFVKDLITPVATTCIAPKQEGSHSSSSTAKSTSEVLSIPVIPVVPKVEPSIPKTLESQAEVKMEVKKDECDKESSSSTPKEDTTVLTPNKESESLGNEESIRYYKMYLAITQAFPCRCRLGDHEVAPLVEADVQRAMEARRLTLVGWYHSHPFAPASPTLRDLDSQLDHQMKMKGSSDASYTPCVGVIVVSSECEVAEKDDKKVISHKSPRVVMKHNILGCRAVNHELETRPIHEEDEVAVIEEGPTDLSMSSHTEVKSDENLESDDGPTSAKIPRTEPTEVVDLESPQQASVSEILIEDVSPATDTPAD